MGVKVARESDGRITVAVTGASTATMSPVEARLLAIKLLLASEELSEAMPSRSS